MSIRTLPKRVTPLDGEAIDSWTESLAIAHQAQLGEVAAALGLPWRPWPPWVVSLTGEQSSKISAATGLPPDRIGEMSLRKYDGRALEFADDGTSFSRAFPFGARGWSRYCPKCLDETSGRWRLQWRLGWAFACLTHNCLLVDQCPSCLNHQRERQHPHNVVPRAGICCGNFASATCGGDLRSAQFLEVDPDGPIIASQNTILKIIDTDTAGFPVYREGDVDARRALGDIKALAVRVLFRAKTEGFAALGWPSLLPGYTDKATAPEVTWRGRPRSVVNQRPPAVAAELAIAAACSTAILESPSIEAAAHRARFLVADRPRKAGRGLVRSLPDESSLIGNLIVRASQDLTPLMQLRYRASGGAPGAPDETDSRLSRLTAALPSSLWDGWCARLCVPGRYTAMPLVLSCGVLLSGASISPKEAGVALGGDVGGPLIEKRLDMLSRTPFWEGISTALIRLGDYLDTAPAVIDYGRRRSLDYSNLLPEGRWQEICDETGHKRGFGWKPLIARGFLYRMISGSPMDSVASPLPSNLEANFWYLAKDFPHVITQQIAARLSEEARRFLDEFGIAEPITWEPPLDLMSDLALPGVDPRDVDVAELHRLTAATSSSLTRTAQELGVSAGTVRYLLTKHPAPSKDVPAERTYLPVDDIIRRVPLRRLKMLYADNRNSLPMIANAFGISQKHLRRVLRFYNIPPRA